MSVLSLILSSILSLILSFILLLSLLVRHRVCLLLRIPLSCCVSNSAVLSSNPLYCLFADAYPSQLVSPSLLLCLRVRSCPQVCYICLRLRCVSKSAVVSEFVLSRSLLFTSGLQVFISLILFPLRSRRHE